VKGVGDKAASCMTGLVQAAKLTARKGMSLDFTCVAAIVPPAEQMTLAALTKAKTPIVHIGKDEWTIDGKAVGDGPTWDLAPPRAIVEIDPDVTMARLGDTLWPLRDAGVEDVRFAVKSGKTWTLLPVLQGFATNDTDHAASVLLTADAIHVGTIYEPITIARGKRGYDYGALASQLAKLAKRGTRLGVDLTADDTVTWSEIAQVMQLAAKAGFTLVPLVARDSTVVEFETH
jgi:hypothetical protein